MVVSEVVKIMEHFAPSPLAESYDNVGLMVGDNSMRVTGILLTLDVVMESIDEAIEKGFNMIISHHPLIFKPLKSLTGRDSIEKIVIKAIKHNIAIYSSHTNSDKTYGGVSFMLAEALGIKNLRILSPMQGSMLKLTIFAPFDYANDVRLALADSGAGFNGMYDSCSFSSEGEGRFRAGDNTQPFVGERGVIHSEREEKIETILQSYRLERCLSAAQKVHPYEEMAYEVSPINNKDNRAGLGVYGELDEEVEIDKFLNNVKSKLGINMIRYSTPHTNIIRSIAVCGGSGSSLIRDAIRAKVDLYLTGDIKYHDFFSTEKLLTIADIGHFESEQFILDKFYEVLTKKITTFAVCKSRIDYRPIKSI